MYDDHAIDTIEVGKDGLEADMIAFCDGGSWL